MSAEENSSVIQVTVRGPLGRGDEAYAVSKLQHVLELAHEPVLAAHLVIHPGPDQSGPDRIRMEIGLNVNGRAVRAHIAASTAPEAADLLQDRLRRQLTKQQTRAHNRGHRTGHRHDQVVQPAGAPTRDAVHWRRPEDREVVRRKTFALHPLDPEEAALEMDQLDHDFFLFTDRATGGDAVVERHAGGGVSAGLETRNPDAGIDDGTNDGTNDGTGDGTGGGHEVHYSVITGPPALSEAQARDRLDTAGEPFVFHLGEDDGRGRVLYVRHDGHYGLITAT